MISTYKPRRNYLIDLLRFLAAAWVALFHFNDPKVHLDNWYRDFCKIGNLGVPIFFIISGFCICIAERHTKTAREFIIKRFFRIFPPYWFSIVVVLACIIIIRIITGANSEAVLPKTPGAILATLALYTQPLSHVPKINWVYWTLPYELFFYFIIFLSLLLPRKIKLIFPLVLTAISIVLPLQAEGPAFFFNELPTFMLGYSLFLIISKGENIWLSGLLMVLSMVGIYIKHPLVSYLLAVYIVCGLILLDNWKPLKNNFFSRLGDYSYSIYLIHVPIGIYLFRLIKYNQQVQTNITLDITADVVLLTLIIYCSKLMYTYIELPSIKLGKKMSNKTTPAALDAVY